MRVIVTRILKQVKTAFCVCFVVLYGHLKYGFWVHFWRSVLFHKTYSAVCSLESGPPHAWWSLPCPCVTWCSSCSATPWTPGPLSWQQLSTCPVLKIIAIKCFHREEIRKIILFQWRWEREIWLVRLFLVLKIFPQNWQVSGLHGRWVFTWISMLSFLFPILPHNEHL